MLRPFRFARAFSFFLFGSLLAHAVPWLAVESDLPSDPAVRWGTLPNGVRYAILPNDVPKNRVSIRLLVSAGSLHEREDERGLAHFVEHMAFRGTRRHPGDSLAQELALLGIGFGPDNTAFTGPNYTVYHLELPDASDAMVRRGLDVFREYASELTFDRALIEKERGVVLSEKATRDTPSARLGAAQLRFLWPKAREARREPIGLEEQVRHFTRKQFVDFYDAWYRPERLALIIVGNVAPEAAEKLVASTFGSLVARAPAREEPTDLLTPSSRPPDVSGWLDKGLIGVEFSLEHPSPDPRAPNTVERRARGLQRALAMAVMQQRLSRIAHAADGDFVSPSATLSAPIPGWLVVALTVEGRIDNWQKFAAAIEQEHRRAILHGFTEDEIVAAKASLRINFEQEARSAATRRSEQLAANLESALLYGQVFVTPAKLRDDALPLLATATPADCLKAFRELWGEGSLHVFLGSNPIFNIGTKDIARTLNASRAIAVEPPVARPPVVFAYTITDPPGQLVREEHLADLDIRLAEFSNGVRLNFKSTDFEADLVNVTVRVGDGQLTQPRDQPGLDFLANTTLIRGGLRRHSQDELREILAGHAFEITFHVQPDAFVFYTRCSRSELKLCLELVIAYLTDAAHRPEALRDAQADFGSMYADLAASASGPTTFKVERTLIRNDRRFGYPEHDELAARTLDEATAWLEPQFRKGAIEIGVVGDVPWTEVSAAVANTFGTLAPREPHADISAAAAIHFQTPSPTPYVATTGTQLKQASLAWFWPVPDLKDTPQERRCYLLADALTDRLRVRLREELGAAYAPSAAFVEHEGIPGFCYFSLYAEVGSAQVVKAAEVIRREIDALRTRGFSDDDFLRVKQPFLRSREDDLRNNAYWSFSVLHDAQQHPERLSAARDRTSDTAAITRANLDSLARRYLDPARGFMFVAEPGVTHFWGRK